MQVPGVVFNHQDLLQSDLTGASTLMLTSFCWDEELHALAAAKICQELEAGSIVIDYTSNLDKCQGLKQIVKIPILVSWSDHQMMYVYIKT